MRASCYVQKKRNVFHPLLFSRKKENNIFAKRAINYFYFKIHGDIYTYGTCVYVEISTYVCILKCARGFCLL